MRTFNGSLALALGCAFVWNGGAYAQGRGGGDWTTVGADAQRSNWVRSDPKISVERLQKPGFALAWKIKLSGEPSIASTLDRYIGYRGFRSYAFVGSASGELAAIDSDLGRVDWRKKVPGATTSTPAAGCTSGMTANVARPTSPMIQGGGRANAVASGGRGRAARSGVGEPGQGAITISTTASPAAGAANAGRGPGVPAAGGRGGAGFVRGSFLYALSSDGMLHSMYASNGDEPKPAMQFLPAKANARDLILVDNVAYALTTSGCGGVPNGVWALDTLSSLVAKWTPNGDLAGPGFAFGPDATVYAATTAGELVALEPKTLQLKSAYKTPGQGFSSAPLVFQYNTKTIVAAATKDGHLHLVDGASLSGAAHPAAVTSGLSSWEDAAGTRWILGAAKDSVTAWKVVDKDGAPVIQPGWKSAELASPQTPVVINGVVFTVSNSPSAVLHALDGATGKELWNSGKTMTAAVHNSAVSGSGSQIYIGTSDGMIYAFGFPIEH